MLLGQEHSIDQPAHTSSKCAAAKPKAFGLLGLAILAPVIRKMIIAR
jgi:hypothetical protein